VNQIDEWGYGERFKPVAQIGVVYLYDTVPSLIQEAPDITPISIYIITIIALLRYVVPTISAYIGNFLTPFVGWLKLKFISYPF
jgi:hypothetical protein